MRHWQTPLVTATFLAVATPWATQAVTNGTKSTFESASVKPLKSATSGKGTTRLQPDGGFSATNVTLRQLIEFAYQRHPFDRRKVTGGPAWGDSDRFDIVARAAGEHEFEPDGSSRQTLAMVQTLLAERFKLKVHEEDRNREVYVLMLAGAEGQLGPKLRRTEVDCGAVMKGQGPPMQPGQAPPCSTKTLPGRLFANTFTMPAIASLMSPQVNRVVIDRTGLTGRFDVELEAAEIKPPPGYTPGPSDLALPPAAGPSIFVAVREQLGLKLEPQVASVPLIVIDGAEKPTPD